MWSRQNLEGYMAVTAHYCAKASDGRLVLRSQLVAFRHVQGSHSGANLAKTFISVIKEIGCLNRVSLFRICLSLTNSDIL
jgi:hypothetical protein